MFLSRDVGDLRIVFANDLHFMAHQCARVHAQRVLQQIARFHLLGNPADFGVALLHGDDLLDVLNVVPQQIHFLEQGGLFGGQMIGQLPEIARQLPAPGIGADESAQVVGAFLKEGDDFCKVAGFGFFQAVDDQEGRHVHAVEHIAHVMENARGHFSHTGDA